MRPRLFGLAILSAACVAAQPVPAPISELNGRVARTPLACVKVTATSESLRPSVDDGHVLLWGSGNTIWVNRLDRSCRFHPDNDVLVVDVSTSSLCRGDIIRSFDRLSKIPGPSCVLNDFVPYTRENR